MVVPLALRTLFARGKYKSFFFLWSSRVHIENKTKTSTVAVDYSRGFYKAVFVVVIVVAVIIVCIFTYFPQWLIETIWNLLESVAQENRVFLVLTTSHLNLFTFLFPLLAPGCSQKAA